MVKRIVITILLSICLFLIANTIIAGVNRKTHQEKPYPTARTSPFRYVITENKITEGTRYPEGGSLKLRGVDILLDPKAFSEPNLRQLVELLSKRFPKPEVLLVNIYTNLDDMLTPEENDIPASGPVDLTATPNHAWAFYIRNSEGERLDYHTKKPGDAFRSIQLRGKD